MNQLCSISENALLLFLIKSIHLLLLVHHRFIFICLHFICVSFWSWQMSSRKGMKNFKLLSYKRKISCTGRPIRHPWFQHRARLSVLTEVFTFQRINVQPVCRLEKYVTKYRTHFLLCSRNSINWQNDFPQMSQTYGLSPVWSLSWTCKL